jgi:hypothetical protein
MIIEKLESLLGKFGSLMKELPPSVSVIVGYTQRYAIFVHENLTAHHNVGQAKFLEQPARQFSKDIAQVVSKAVKNGTPLPQALVLGGLFLQRESQKLCPVDTGALKASAFTRLEK